MVVLGDTRSLMVLMRAGALSRQGHRELTPLLIASDAARVRSPRGPEFKPTRTRLAG